MINKDKGFSALSSKRPDRCPAFCSIIWIYLQDLGSQIKGFSDFFVVFIVYIGVKASISGRDEDYPNGLEFSLYRLFIQLKKLNYQIYSLNCIGIGIIGGTIGKEHGARHSKPGIAGFGIHQNHSLFDAGHVIFTYLKTSNQIPVCIRRSSVESYLNGSSRIARLTGIALGAFFARRADSSVVSFKFVTGSQEWN